MCPYRRRRRINGRNVLTAASITVIITVILVFITGLKSHRSLLDNGLISLSILAGFIFIFLTLGLYYAVYVKDDLSGKLKLKWVKAQDILPEGMAEVDLSLGCADEAKGALAWIGISILLVIAIFFLGTILWVGFVIVGGAIYWLLLRSLRLIFKRSAICHGHLLKSMAYALLYTILYTGWVYGVIYLAIELKR